MLTSIANIPLLFFSFFWIANILSQPHFLAASRTKEKGQFLRMFIQSTSLQSSLYCFLNLHNHYWFFVPLLINKYIPILPSPGWKTSWNFNHGPSHTRKRQWNEENSNAFQHLHRYHVINQYWQVELFIIKERLFKETCNLNNKGLLQPMMRTLQT